MADPNVLDGNRYPEPNQIGERQIAKEITEQMFGTKSAYEFNRQSQKMQLDLFGGCVPDLLGDVFEFHKAFHHPVLKTCAFPPQNRQEFRKAVLHEELDEFDEAYEKQDMAGMADAIVDLIYYAIGWALEYGVPLAKVWQAVQDANMSKLWTYEECQTITEKRKEGWSAKCVAPEGAPLVLTGPEATRCYAVYDGAGKARKPPSWVPPDEKIHAIINEAMRISEQETNRANWNASLARLEEQIEEEPRIGSITDLENEIKDESTRLGESTASKAEYEDQVHGEEGDTR
jgi:predicted HAD superfamily Cof-like phosphohydrolase